MKRRACLLCCFALASSAFAAAGSPRPNIIVILADDFGWGSSTPYGARRLNTPHLDRLAHDRGFTRPAAGK